MKTLIRSFVCVLSVALLAIIPACNGKQSGDEEAARREAGEENRQPASIHLTPAAMAVAEIRIAPVLKKTFRPPFFIPMNKYFCI